MYKLIMLRLPILLIASTTERFTSIPMWISPTLLAEVLFPGLILKMLVIKTMFQAASTTELSPLKAMVRYAPEVSPVVPEM
jgi:hypothetical protein